MKALIAGVLWFWCVWSLMNVVGAPETLGAVVGAIIGLFVGFDPRHLIWRRRQPSAATRARLASLSHNTGSAGA